MDIPFELKFSDMSYLSFLDDIIIEDILHLAVRSELGNFGPEAHTALLLQLNGHFTFEGNY